MNNTEINYMTLALYTLHDKLLLYYLIHYNDYMLNCFCSFAEYFLNICKMTSSSFVDNLLVID